MSMFEPKPAPKTPLGGRRLLSPTAGIKVSPLCLGGMSLGSKWAGEPQIEIEPRGIRIRFD